MLALGRLRDRVIARVGAEVVVDPAEAGRYARDDGALGPFPPGLVVRPRERAQVLELVRLCREEAVPLSP
ncbi:MAG TPA: hypothetical protein PKW35_02365, partial [Nannocystaceae bacterium]|nr:hypothetical protein [Nannocystaceae bacterium]